MERLFRVGDLRFKVHAVTGADRVQYSVVRLENEASAEPSGVLLEVLPVGAGEFLVEGPAGPRRGFAVRDGDVVWVQFGGSTWRLTEERGAAPRRSATAAGAITSPMPGQVLRTLVAVGDEVKKGQPLLVVEAMKMQLEISAPHAGKVRSLAAGPGDKILAGVPLAEVEPAVEKPESTG